MNFQVIPHIQRRPAGIVRYTTFWVVSWPHIKHSEHFHSFLMTDAFWQKRKRLRRRRKWLNCYYEKKEKGKHTTPMKPSTVWIRWARREKNTRIIWVQDQEEKAWNITRAVWRRRFRECQGGHSAMVGVVRVIVMVGMQAAVAAGPGIPGELPVAPLNFHCPHEVMMGNKKNKQRTKKRGKVTEVHK